MKKYIFAKLYFSLLKIFAILVLIVSGVRSYPSLISFFEQSRTIKEIKKSEIPEINFTAVTRQITLATETLISDPVTVSAIKNRIDAIPGRNQSTWKGAHLSRATRVLDDFSEITSAVKRQSLEGFLSQMDPLIDASQSRIQQLSPTSVTQSRVEDPSVADVIPDLLFDPTSREILQFYNNQFPLIRSFIRENIRYYTSSTEALRMANKSLEELEAFDLHVQRLQNYIDRQSSQTARTSHDYSTVVDSSENRDERLVAREFQEILVAIRGDVIENHTENWTLDRIISNMKNAVQGKLRQLQAASRQRRTDAVSVATYLIQGCVVAILLMIIRDFLIATIDIANNTKITNDLLSSATLEYEENE